MTAQPDGEQLRALLPSELNERIDLVEVFSEVESTNSYMLDQPAPAAGRCKIVLAESQSAGRGRLGNSWESPAGAGLYLSVACTPASPLKHPGTLTPAIGVAVASALRNVGLEGVGLKWPNDLILADGKLGGILTELKQTNANNTSFVIGIGINIEADGQIDSGLASVGRVADLAEGMESPPTPVELAAEIIEQLLIAIDAFELTGFAAFLERYRRLDWLAGRAVIVTTATTEHRGVVQGIGDQAELLLAVGDELLRIIAGSVRLQHDE